MKNLLIRIILVYLPVVLGVPMIQAETGRPVERVKLAFRLESDASFSFDTGVLKGKLHAGGKSLGLTEVIHQSTGVRLDKDPGLLDLYRLFAGRRRFLPDVRDFPSTVRVLKDGRAEISWDAADGRPFELKAVYRWIDPATVEMELTVTSRAELAAFEVFQSSYASPGFSSCRLYCSQQGESKTAAGFLVADQSLGDWLMAPRKLEAVALIQDGRWKNEPYPVDWKILPAYALPLSIRRDPVSGLSLLFMTRPEDCLAVSTPQEKDDHTSLYFSLFGGDIRQGNSRRAIVRMVVSSTLTDRKALEIGRAFLAGQRAAQQR